MSSREAGLGGSVMAALGLVTAVAGAGCAEGQCSLPTVVSAERREARCPTVVHPDQQASLSPAVLGWHCKRNARHHSLPS